MISVLNNGLVLILVGKKSFCFHFKWSVKTMMYIYIFFVAFYFKWILEVRQHELIKPRRKITESRLWRKSYLEPYNAFKYKNIGQSSWSVKKTRELLLKGVDTSCLYAAILKTMLTPLTFLKEIFSKDILPGNLFLVKSCIDFRSDVKWSIQLDNQSFSKFCMG